MPRRKTTAESAPPLRTRLTIYPDGDGMMEYLNNINVAGLHSEILHLMRMGFHFRNALARRDGERGLNLAPFNQAVTMHAMTADTQSPANLDPKSGQAPRRDDSSPEDVAGVEQFSRIFGAAHRRTAGL